MSIVRVIETAAGLGGDGDEKGVRNYSRSWLIETTGGTDDDPFSIMASGYLPVQYDPCPFDATALCLNLQMRNAAADGCSKFWDATAKYSTKYDNQQQGNPLERPIKKSLSFNYYRRDISVDAEGKPITNSAGEKPNETAQIDACHPLLRFVRNEATIPVERAQLYNLATNSDEFYGAPAGTMRMNSISTSDLQRENDVDFYAVTYEVEYRKETWKLQFLNIGHSLRTSGGKTIYFSGSEPFLLKATAGGDAIIGTTTGLDTASEEPQMCKRIVYPSKPFAALGL